jgi:glutamate formiminotransferase
VSEGRDPKVLAALVEAAGHDLLDVHHDPDHHRAVLTLVGEASARRVAAVAVEAIDLAGHVGVHPRLGVVDVVPFVPLGGATMDDAVRARDRFARWAAEQLGLPCFVYGPERTLPEIRRRAWRDLAPDVGPEQPHATAGAACVGARGALVAFNVWLDDSESERAGAIAAAVRGDGIRALAFVVGGRPQVSMNLIEPDRVGPAEAYDRVAALGRVVASELVGLVPAETLARIPRPRWEQLDLADDRTFEARLEHR